MFSTELQEIDYPGFNGRLVTASWPHIADCRSAHVHDSEGVRGTFEREFPELDWNDQVVPLLCRGVEVALDCYLGELEHLAVPLMIRSQQMGIKVPVDLRYDVDLPREQIAAVMRALPYEALPETIRFGDPGFLAAQEGKGYDETLRALRELSREKHRFFTCNEIDHHLFAHIFENGDYRRTFFVVDE